MTPTLIGIILACILAVIFGPPLFDMLREYGVPLIGATFRRFFQFEWHGIMSSIADDDGSSAGSDQVVLGQQNQENQNQNANFEMIKSFLSEHNLTDEEAIIILANMRRLSGDDLLSANKIRDVVGGADAVVKHQVAAQRRARPKPRVSHRIERPANGWR